ncbi:type I restriction enzyme S subunit [Kibdelosporangium banguiense]|uniref:Type I restriction enzyme S subunit n=1 Tax=Kibdelosporangium banguiense TaxID=1365924 RepID=A0ABS4TH67_9PSEU|nr:restriction endonuclease subunit S [Kibdelosporangium banguiense]MBP2323776.1 type I restriction enzyme S subunit [Kibdelosporangium banguiense]
MSTTVVSEPWTTTRLGWLFQPVSDRGHEDERVLSVYRDHGVIPKDSRTDNFNRTPENLSNYQLVHPGDLVVNRMKAWQGSLGISEYQGIVSPDYEVLRPTVPEYDHSFLHSLLRSRALIDQYALRSTGIRPSQWRLYWDEMKTIEISLPAVEQQRAIADYLDRETARIDTLIEEQQRLIEMLRGRRKAVVEQAVFSGLKGTPTNSNAEPWLPPTPSHWRVVQLGFVSDTVAGYAFPSDGFSADGDHVRLLRGVNVKPGRINWTDTVYWDVEVAAVPSEFDLEVGDLVFGMDRPFVGGGVRVAAISGNDLPALLLQRVMRIRPNDEAGRGYMRYVMSTDAFFNYLEPLFTGVSVPHVSEWQVRKFKMPFPPLDEQTSIAAYLDEQTAKIDTLIEETERFIELARERRAALITAAVTGQIDVREMA